MFEEIPAFHFLIQLLIVLLPAKQTIRSELLSLSLEAEKQSTRHQQAFADAATETARFVCVVERTSWPCMLGFGIVWLATYLCRDRSSSRSSRRAKLSRLPYSIRRCSDYPSRILLTVGLRGSVQDPPRGLAGFPFLPLCRHLALAWDSGCESAGSIRLNMIESG